MKIIISLDWRKQGVLCEKNWGRSAGHTFRSESRATLDQICLELSADRAFNEMPYKELWDILVRASKNLRRYSNIKVTYYW